jgi:hypothetical protein
MAALSLEELTTEQGRIYHVAGIVKTEVLNIPPIRIQQRWSEPKGVSNRIFRYAFQLNAPPDETWNQLLIHQLVSQVRELKLNVSRDILEFETTPANLQSRYNDLKEAIERANSRYAQYREKVIYEIQERDKQRAQTEKQRQQSQQRVQKGWDELEL